MNYPIKKPRGHVHYMDVPKIVEDDILDEQMLLPWHLRDPLGDEGGEVTIEFSAEFRTTPVIDVESEVSAE